MGWGISVNWKKKTKQKKPKKQQQQQQQNNNNNNKKQTHKTKHNKKNKTKKNKKQKTKKHDTISGLTSLVNLTMRSNLVSPLNNMGKKLNGFSRENELIVSLVKLFSSWPTLARGDKRLGKGTKQFYWGDNLIVSLVKLFRSLIPTVRGNNRLVFPMNSATGCLVYSDLKVKIKRLRFLSCTQGSRLLSSTLHWPWRFCDWGKTLIRRQIELLCNMLSFA